MDPAAAQPAAPAADELAFAGPLRLAALLRAGEVRPRELVELALRRIERLDPQLGAFRVVLAERALEEADRAERVPEHGVRPLHGVPVAVKDDVAVAGQVLAMGTSAQDRPEEVDAELVRRVRAAGCIVVGLTRTPELTLWGFTETPSGGATRNPWDLDRTPGGSSGGSAAAVAAGLVPLATASDGVGSIRIPAALCGLFGLKPQRGRLPTAPRAEAWNGLSTPGFLTRGVEDAAFAYETLTGLPWLAAARRPPGRLRVAVSTRLPPGIRATVDASVLAAVEETAELLRSLGHHVARHDPQMSQAMARRVVVRYLAGAAEEARSVEHPERLEARTRRIARAGEVAERMLARARAGEAADAARLTALLRDHDVLLTPTVATAPPRIGAWAGRGALATWLGNLARFPYTGAWNHAGVPAASVPAGRDADGLPRAVQLVGPPGGEPLLLSLSRQLEEARPWTDARPPVS